jgi:hypothetical protein
MAAQHRDSLQAFDLINSAAQARLRERIDAAGGDIDAVRGEVRAELARLDDKGEGEPNHQADRAFYVGQLAYLDLLQQAAQVRERPPKQGVWARLRSTFRRAEVTH